MRPRGGECTCLNAPFGAWCFLTRHPCFSGLGAYGVLMHLMALGAF